MIDLVRPKHRKIVLRLVSLSSHNQSLYRNVLESLLELEYLLQLNHQELLEIQKYADRQQYFFRQGRH